MVLAEMLSEVRENEHSVVVVGLIHVISAWTLALL